jgi:hypothetical protein
VLISEFVLIVMSLVIADFVRDAINGSHKLITVAVCKRGNYVKSI